MIRPDEFYKPDEHLDRPTKRRIWISIQKRIPAKRPLLFFINDRRSFAYGMAATVLVYLASVGAITVARRTIENAQPTAIQVDKAYQTAISEFERFVPSVASAPSYNQIPKQGELVARNDQLRMLDEAIVALRNETNGNDVSPMKRSRLRQLYSMKLHILQQMIEQGEIEL
ncbi:MAG TPA: hypothetical protein DCP63_12295 [Bacteroidetes bacterium]|nr:hypothetical protein [Bacteroidota bacterium]